MHSTTAKLRVPLTARVRAGMQSVSAHPMSSNFTWMLMGHIVYSLCQWLMLTALAKLSTSELVGSFSGALAVTAPIIMFTNLQLRAVQATDAQRSYSFSDYLVLRLVSTAIGLGIIAALAFLAYDTEQSWVILVVGVAKAAEATSDIAYGLFQQREQMRYIALSLMVRGILSAVVLAVGVYLTGQLIWGVVGLALAWLLVLLVYDVRNALRLVTEREPVGTNTLQNPLLGKAQLRRMLQLARLALPLGIVMMLISLNSNIPRYFVESSLGNSALGIYSALAYLQVAGNTIVLALGQSASPRLAISYANRNRQQFLRVGALMLACVLALSAGGLLITLLWGRPVLTLIYTPEYGEQATVLSWVMAGAGILYVESVLGYVVTAMREFRRQVLVYVAGTAVLLLLSVLLIPRYGLVGAAQAVMVTAAVRVAIFGAIATRGSRKHFRTVERTTDEPGQR